MPTVSRETMRLGFQDRCCMMRVLSKTVATREPLKIQSSPKCKARGKFRRAAYVLYVSKKFFTQRSSWDEIVNF